MKDLAKEFKGEFKCLGEKLKDTYDFQDQWKRI